jgi:hypothetical protein
MTTSVGWKLSNESAWNMVGGISPLVPQVWRPYSCSSFHMSQVNWGCIRNSRSHGDLASVSRFTVNLVSSVHIIATAASRV